MNEAKDFSVAYTLWTEQGTVLYQNTFVLFGNTLSKGPIIENLKAHVTSNFPVNWAQVAAISYDIFETGANGKGFSRYSVWIDSTELDKDGENLEAVAVIPIPATIEVSPQENTAVLEAVEEILREEREQNLPEPAPEEA